MTLCLNLRRWLCRWIAWLCPHACLRLVILDPNGAPMSSLSQPNDALATLTVAATDQFDRPVPVPAGLSASTSDPAIATVAVDATKSQIEITPVAIGSATITVSAGGLSTSFDVEVSAPTATALVINLAAVQFTPLPAAPEQPGAGS